jgi:hypothetical protein
LLISTCDHTCWLFVRQAFKQAGIEFIDENGGCPGVRLRKHQQLRKPK